MPSKPTSLCFTMNLGWHSCFLLELFKGPFFFYISHLNVYVGSAHWGDSQPAPSGSRPADFLIGADGYASLGSQSEAQADVPIMDHWNVNHTQVSLRDIMLEEHARQQKMEKVWHIGTARSSIAKGILVN